MTAIKEVDASLQDSQNALALIRSALLYPGFQGVFWSEAAIASSEAGIEILAGEKIFNCSFDRDVCSKFGRIV